MASASAAASQPRGCTNFKLRQLTRLVTRHYERFFAASGLRITQYSLLSHVDRLHAVPCAELADAMQLSPSALSRTLQPLVQQGWLLLTAGGDGGDARRRFVQITPSGRAKREHASALWKEAQLALNQRLGSERVAALHTLLDSSIDELAADTGGDADPDPLPGEPD